jgi:hypothetical protein
MDLATCLLKRSSDLATPAERERFFDETLGMYTFDFFASDATRAFVRAHFVQHGADPRVFALFAHGDASAVASSLQFRFPVYFGRPFRHLYSTAAVERTLGYHPDACVDVAAPHVGFVVCGPAVVRPDLPAAAVAPTVGFVHAFGVNFESLDTADAAAMLEGTTGDFAPEGLRRFVARQTELMGMIVAGAARVALLLERPGATVVKMPAIGLGAFMSAASPSAQAAAFAAAEAAVRAAVVPPRMTLVYCMPARGDVSDVLFADVGKRNGNNTAVVHTRHGGGTLAVARGAPNADMFAVPADLGDGAFVVVNPWDTKSFIGNGGAMDGTPDGFTVSGGGPGAKLANTSFLHNVFFRPEPRPPTRTTRTHKGPH